MPKKLNSAGEMQNYIPAGNGDASGEYGNTETGSNKHFKTFKKGSFALKNESADIPIYKQYTKITDEQINEGRKKVEEGSSNVVEKFVEKPIDRDEIRKRGGLTDEEIEQCIKVATDIYGETAKKEPQITEDIVGVAENIGVKMFGLNARRKQITSLAGKIGEDAKTKRESFEKMASNIKDATRYTTILNEDNFVEEYNKFKKELESKGYKEVRCKNFYDGYDKGEECQKAIQCVYETPDGYRFELQYHTPDSLAVKNSFNHKLYEEYRQKTTTQERKNELLALMYNAGQRVKNPKDILTIKSHDETK